MEFKHEKAANSSIRQWRWPGFVNYFLGVFVSASTPGNSRPPRNSNEAPPPVET
jgi:hypothetical protein